MTQTPAAPQQSTPTLGTLHHVEIYVSNLEATKSFWGWLMEALNYTVFQQWDGGISYLHNETYIVFVQAEDRFQTPAYHRCRVGLNHLAFHAPTKEIIDNITQTLRAKGVTILYPDKHPYAGGPDYYAVFFEDPDRIKVEIVLTEEAACEVSEQAPKPSEALTQSELMETLLDFRNARDWAQFHTPENLAKSISIEAAELLEHYQWGDPSDPEEIADEIADILIYAYLMSNAIGVDPAQIMLNKLEKNKKRFPIDAVKGNSGKHTRVDL